MFNLLDTIPFQSTSDPSRSSRSVPRSYHGRPFRKPPCRFHPRSKKGAVSCCSAVPTHDTSTLMSVAISDVPCTTSSYTAKNSTDQGLGEPKAGLSVHQMQGYSGGTGHAYHPVCSFDDSLHRRHSVPVDQVRPGPPPIRSCQGRRMPSPNPAFMPSRNTQFFFPGPPQASSSDADVSQSAAMQLPCTRFPSPSSAYENTYPSGCPRSLIPPATAPPTRMPSPSGMRKLSAGLPPCPQEIAASLLLTVPTSPCQITSTCPCIPSLGFSSRVDECARTMPMVLHNTAGSLPPQVCLGTDFQQQPHSVFQRNALLPNSSTSLDCICISPGLSDLHQTCSLQTPSNPYVCAIIVNRQVGHGLDAVRTIPPQSCTPHALGRTSYPSASHDHTNLRQSLHSVSGCNYRSPLRDSHSSGTHVITPPRSDTQGTNALASDDRTEWGVSGADRVFSFHPVYATAGNPCTVTSLATSATSEVETGTDFIEHNLDLLTRKVTELAIGEFDSPGE
ncbi:hypothetical protein FGIG_01743 [Fasciola gigantica]|uniref:Uncharacterized protein n=1 Tax=Fasciola gigantica TaxID=46835 RepID=A0A504YVS8_FASGI|nr:hypothetical protein FGIG_01743 [Fasciola gigantica]